MSLYFSNRLEKFKCEEKKDDPAGGGPAPTAAEFAALKESNAAILAKLEALTNPTKPKPDDKKPEDLEDELTRKARLEREGKEKTAAQTKVLSSAIGFNLKSKEWLKTNESLLPKGVAGILEAADKENYSDEVEKANAIKVGLVSEFFAQKANLDLLTDNQKQIVEDFKKLTKTDKAERVQALYDSVFEPAFETLKKIRKAELLSKGQVDPTNMQSAHVKKMNQASRAYYLKEKGQ